MSTCIYYRSIDDIVMSYVVSIVEEQSEEFSPDDFLEMISAYIPDIVPSELSAAKTNIWMSGLVKEIDRTKKTKSDPCHGVDLKLVIQESLNKVQVSKPNTVEEENFKQQKRVRLARLSETSDGSEGGSNDGDDFQQTVIQLLEMFPYSCSIEVSHCLQHCLGDVEKTISTIIYRHEHGQSLKPKFQNSKVVDDKEVKERILGKYGFVDKEEDSRFHRPALPKSVSSLSSCNEIQYSRRRLNRYQRQN